MVTRLSKSLWVGLPVSQDATAETECSISFFSRRDCQNGHYFVIFSDGNQKNEVIPSLDGKIKLDVAKFEKEDEKKKKSIGSIRSWLQALSENSVQRQREGVEAPAEGHLNIWVAHFRDSPTPEGHESDAGLRKEAALVPPAAKGGGTMSHSAWTLLCENVPCAIDKGEGKLN